MLSKISIPIDKLPNCPVPFVNQLTILLLLNIYYRGIPNIPIKIAVKIFNPIWNSNVAPIKFITYIKKAPNIEFITIFKIIFNGTIKILPIINKVIIHAKYISIILLSIFYHPINLMFKNGQLFIHYITLSSYNLIFNSFTISKAIDLLFAFFIR